MCDYKPTYLYVKTHIVTGLKYFGKTTNPNPSKYKGSGKRWLNHIRKHGNHVTTEIIGYYTDKKECIREALEFSIKNDIHKSGNWANLILENGINGGGDCRQMLTTASRNKAKYTSLKKFGTEHPFKNELIREKAKKVMVEKYGTTNFFNTTDSIEKRNETNMKLYGSKCAANKNGNKKSKETQKKLLNRKSIKLIKRLCIIKNRTLPKGWYYQSDQQINEIYIQLQNLPDWKPDSNGYNKHQLWRYNCIYRPNVLHIRQLALEYNLKLGHNWFQQPDEIISAMLSDILSKYPDIPPLS